MGKREDRNTRYFVDLDLGTKKVIGWGHDDRYALVQEWEDPSRHRIFLTKGQYHKLEKRHAELMQKRS